MADQFEGRKLYYVRNVFLLSDGVALYEIDEPIKWGDIDIQIKWDQSVKGYKFEFSDEDVLLEFDEPAGYSIIKQSYADKFEGMNMTLIFGELDTADVLTVLFEAKLNFDSYKENKYTIKMNCERRSFSDKFRTRFDTKVDLYRTTSIDGLVLPAMPMRELFLHPRLLTKEGEFIYNEVVESTDIPLTEEIIDGPSDTFYYTTVPPFKATSLNIDDFQEPVAPQGLLLYTGTSLPLGLAKRRLSFECSLEFEFIMPNHSNVVTAGFSIYKRSNISGGGNDLYPPTVDPPFNDTYLIHAEDCGNLAGTKNVNGSLSGVIEVGPDEAVFLKAWVLGGDASLAVTNFNYLNYDDFELIVEEETVYQASVIDAPQIHEAVNRQLEITLDKQDVLKSDFLGRIELGYAADGCAANHIVIDGAGVRQMPNRPFNMSTKEWVNSLSNLFCMGLSIERDDDNNEFVRFEPIEYFFRNILLFSFTVVSKYEKGPALDYIFNEMRFGFKKYPQDNQPDSIEDFMTVMEYINPIKTVKSRLDVIVDWILSGYYTEYTRREAFRDNPTNAYETDKDTFLFSGKPHANPTAGVGMTFDAANNQIVITGVFPITEGDVFVISAATGGVSNGPYRAVSAFINHLYTTTTITCAEGQVLTTGAGTGTIDIGTSDRFVCKRDEDFDDIQNVSFPKSVYNLEHHIKRIALRWAKVFNSGLFKTFSSSPSTVGMQFVSGANNTSVITELKDAVTCRYGSVLEPYADFGVNHATLTLQNPLFKANVISFEAPLTWEALNDIRKAFEGRHPEDKDYGYFEWPNPDGVVEKGFILELKFKPTTQMVKVVMLEKYEI